MDELNMLGFFDQSSGFDATQVMYCIDNEPSPTNEDTLIIEQSPENIPTKEAPEVRDDFDKDFAFPEMMDDEKDDFSWLMKVCPTSSNHSDQTVPGEEFHVYDSAAANFNSINATKETSSLPPAPEESVSMLVDVMLSEMDVSSLITSDVNEITFHKDEPNKDDENKETPKLAHDKNMKSSKSQTRKRSQILRNRTTTALTETPISLRRSQRKRSFTEMIQTEVTMNKGNSASGSRSAQRKNKRPRLQSTPGESKIIIDSNEKSTVAVAITETNTSTELVEPDAIILDEKPVKERLIIKFRKSEPVNPIDKSLVSKRSFQKGLIDPSKILSGEMYLTQSCSPKLMPIMEEDVAVSKWVAKPVVPNKLKELLKMEWITNHNTLANMKAHGKEMLGGKKLTSDGNLKGTFATMDLDNEYERILKFQNEIQCVIDWKRNANKTHTLTEIEKPTNLDITFSNFSNFNNYFNEQLPSDENNLDDDDIDSSADADELNNGIVGAVPVNTVALSKSSSVLCENWSVFKIKGQHFRSNPGVVIVERLSDHVIEQMKAKPKKVTLKSPYYKALTSYFDNRSSSSSFM